MVKLIQTLFLLYLAHVTLGWIRFRYPLSRRNYLQQTAMEMLQNCAGNPEELCGICGEGPNELPTELLSTKDFQVVNSTEGPLEVGLGFRRGMQGYFEMRLCKIGPNSVVNADDCRKVAPLQIFSEYRYMPGIRQNSARIQLSLPADVACERCVLQVKYFPGADTRLAGQLFFDCALLRIPPNLNTPRLSGRFFMSNRPALDTVTFASGSNNSSALPSTNDTSIVDPTGMGLSSIDTPVTESYSTADLKVSTRYSTTTTPPFTEISSKPARGVLETGRNSIIYKNIFTSEVRTSDLQADAIIPSGNGLKQGIVSEPKVYLRQLVDTTPREVVERTDMAETTKRDISSGTEIMSAQVTTGSVPTISTLSNLNESVVTDNLNNVNDTFFSQTPETSTEMKSGITLNLNSSIQTDSYITLNNQTTDQIIVSETQFTKTDTYNRTSITTEQATLGSESTNTVDTPNDTFTTVQTSVVNWTDPYDMYGTNNNPTVPVDYFYDYYTYSEIPENQTSISVENSTNSSTEYFNETTMYTFSLATTEAFTNTTVPDTNDTLKDTTSITSSSESYTVYPYQNDSTTASLDYNTDNFTFDIGSTYPVLDITNRSISTIPQTTHDTFGGFTTEKSVELVTGRSSFKPLISTGMTTTTAVTPAEVNGTTNEIILNDTVTVIDQTITSSVGKPDQQIVNVSNTLFDRVLFPTPKPNQDIVKVPEQITVFPSRYSVPVPTQTTVQRISTPSVSTSNESLVMDGQQTEIFTTLTGNNANVPPVGTTINMEPITQPSTDGVYRRFTDLSTLEITPSPLTITETFQQDVTSQDKVSSLVETTVHGSSDLSGKQPKTTIINIPAQDFPTSSESVQTVIDTTSFDKTQHSMITNTPHGTISLDLSTVTISPHGMVTDKSYQPDTTSQTGDNSITSATLGTFTGISGRDLLDKTNTVSFRDQPISSQETDTGIPGTGSVIVTKPILSPTERTFLSTPDTKFFDPNANKDAQVKDTFYTSTVTPYIQRSTSISTSPGRRMTITEKETETIQQSTITEQARPPNIMQSSTNTPDSLRSNTNQVNTAGQSIDSVSYLPDIDGLVDGIGGIPIQPGMFIDIFIPKFRVDSERNEIVLEELNSTKLLSGVTPAGKDKGSIDVLIEGLNNRERLSNDLKSANRIQKKTTNINYLTFPNILNLNRTSFGQFRQLTLPTSTTSKGQIKTNNQELNRDTFANQFSNFFPNSDKSQTNKEFSTRTNSQEIFISSLETPEVMPPIIVPKKAFSKNNNKIGQGRSVFIGTNSNSNPGFRRPTTERQGIASNTIWKGPGVGISGQSFGLISGPRVSDSSNRNTEGFNNFLGATGPVYIPINEISIPWKDGNSFKGPRQSEMSPDQVSKGNEINTTFSTLWDLNRLNKNMSRESRPPSFDGQFSDQLMPPYIGIPLVWSPNQADDRQIQGTTSPNQQNWNDLPVPDIMPPIKVRLLNLTSQGTFVDNEAGLNKTDDMNRRILLKLEAIVGELQRNRALLTQTLDVNPALEQGLQLSFDRFPTQFTGLSASTRNPTGMFSFGGPRRKLLSEVLQDPVEKVPIVEAQNVLNTQVIKSDQLIDPRGNLPISEVKIGSSIGTAKLLNMLGITDTRPLENEHRGFDIKLSEAKQQQKSIGRESNSSQTLIDADSIGNETYPLFSATLRALNPNTSITGLQNISGNSVVFNTTLENQTLDRREQDHVTNASTYSGIKFTTTAAQDVIMTSTEQVIVDAQEINSTTNQTATNQQSFVTSSNQVIIVPTGSELTNPFEGTNITLPESTTVGTIKGDINQVTTERETPRMLHEVTTSGQRVVLASDTITVVDSLKQRNNLRRNMTAEERKRDRIIRNNFNNRVKGIRSISRRKIAESGKYNLGEMSENRTKNFQPMSIDKDFFLNELNLITKDQNSNLMTKRTQLNEVNSLTKDTKLGEVNIIAKNRQSMPQMNFPNLQNIQLSEFSVAPPVNEKLITVSEVPKEPLMKKNQVFGEDYILNSNTGSGYLANTGVLQINNVEKIATATKNASDYTEANVMVDSIRRINQEALTKTVVEKPLTEANHVINIGHKQTIIKKQVTTPPIGITENYNPPFRQQLKKLVSLSPVAPAFICPEGQLFICKAVGDYSSVPGMKWWCFSHCKNGMELCPEEKCRCTCEMDFRSSKKQSSIPISDVRVREKKIINLTLNGSKEAKITVPIQIQPLGQYQDLSSPGRLVDTKYESILTQNKPIGNSASASKVQQINQPRMTESKSDSVVTGRLIRKKKCIGINAFAGKPEIDRWCTRMCSRNVCPPELCACEDIKKAISSNVSA